MIYKINILYHHMHICIINARCVNLTHYMNAETILLEKVSKCTMEC